MITNCYLAAWSRYASGRAQWMACRLSQYSVLRGRMPRVVRWMGSGLLWVATAVWLGGHYLRFGTWPHWVWCDSLGDCEEAVPTQEKARRIIPPLLYRAVERQYEPKADS